MFTPAQQIFFSAGEASGEAYGALLVEELRSRLAGARFFGLGGPRMEAVGLERIVRSEDVAVMGITEVIRHMPRIYHEYLRLKRSIRARRPDLAILIDFPDVNLRLAEECKRLGIPVIFFVSPQLWAWKKGRIKRVQLFVDRMLVIFPFEEPFYRERGVNATYVGHPLADLPLPSITREQFAAENGLNTAANWISLLPGSRAKEIGLNLPEMLAAAGELAAIYPGVQFVLPLAPTLTGDQVERVQSLVRELGDPLAVKCVRDARSALKNSRASIVASGTATVEAALIGNPFVVVYRVSPITYWIAKRVVTVPHVAMVNLVAEKRLVPELLQDDFTKDKIVQELKPLFEDGDARAEMMAGLKEVKVNLSRPSVLGSAIGNVVGIVVEMLDLAPGNRP